MSGGNGGGEERKEMVKGKGRGGCVDDVSDNKFLFGKPFARIFL